MRTAVCGRISQWNFRDQLMQSKIMFHRLCTQLFTHGVAAFCSCFSSAIMWHTEVYIEQGILLAIQILLPAGMVLGEAQQRENYCDFPREVEKRCSTYSKLCWLHIMSLASLYPQRDCWYTHLSDLTSSIILALASAYGMLFTDHGYEIGRVVALDWQPTTAWLMMR